MSSNDFIECLHRKGRDLFEKEGVTGNLRDDISFCRVLLDNKKNCKKPKIAGYVFTSIKDISIPRVDFISRKDIYTFDKDSVTYEDIKAGEEFYLKPAEMMLLIVRKEYNGKFTGGDKPVRLVARYAKVSGVLSFSLKSERNGVVLKDFAENLLDEDGYLKEKFSSWSSMYLPKYIRGFNSSSNDCIMEQSLRTEYTATALRNMFS